MLLKPFILRDKGSDARILIGNFYNDSQARIKMNRKPIQQCTGTMKQIYESKGRIRKRTPGVVMVSIPHLLHIKLCIKKIIYSSISWSYTVN